MRLRGPNASSLRFRATVWTASAIALLVVASALAINWAVTRTVRDSFDNVLLEQAEDRALLLAGGAAPGSLVTVTGEEVVVVVVGADGSVLASGGTPEPEVLAALVPGIDDVEVITEEDDDGDDDGESSPHGESLRAAVVENADGSRVIVGNEREEIRRALGEVRWILAIGAPLIALIAAAIVRWLSGRALRPVFGMRDDLDGVVRRGGRITEPGTRDEIDELAVTMNGVLDDLERQSEVRRQFVADASHELKSPVANARALIETDGSRARTLGELDRLQAIVDDLLYLAKTDETVAADPTVVDLDDIVFDEAERASHHTDRRIDASGVQPAQVVADRSEVARAVRNLIDNAVRHTSTRVDVALRRHGDAWTLVVDDDGPGIPPDERHRVFERFARLDGDRARADGGTGLGLSIVASIAQRNGGSVAVDEADGGGARLALTLPAAVS